jgi:hypothetical protein
VPSGLTAPLSRSIKFGLAALDGTKPVADRHGFRFADPMTGKEIWLSDIH